MITVELRPACDDDRDFVFDAFKATLETYIEWAWGWDEDVQRRGFFQPQVFKEYRVITVEGRRAGVLRIKEQESIHFVSLIVLLPEFQRRGIGAKLLMEEAARADKADKQLHLKIIKINPAKALYERLGFFGD